MSESKFYILDDHLSIFESIKPTDNILEILATLKKLRIKHVPDIVICKQNQALDFAIKLIEDTFCIREEL